MGATSESLTLVFDMDSTLLSIETLDRIIETALRRSLGEDAVGSAMKTVEAEMAKGMDGSATLLETIPARIAIAKQQGAPVRREDFDHVVSRVQHTVTQEIVDTLSRAYSSETPLRVIIVSGGPQEAVDETVQVLQGRISEASGTEVRAFEGYGNKIVVTESGDFDSTQSEIHAAKTEVLEPLQLDPAKTLMIGDGATDMQVYDAGVAKYFVAYGGWVQRTKLFDRPENVPLYQKVAQHKQFSDALDAVISDVRDHG